MCREVISVCFEIILNTQRIKNIHTLCKQNAAFSNIKPMVHVVTTVLSDAECFHYTKV